MSGYPRARTEGIVAEEVGDEVVIYVQATQMAHALSSEAACVWRQCDGETSAKDIARRLGLEQARVSQALEELSGAGLIEEPEGISRRALYKRTAKVGAAALGSALIYSVAIGPASAAASGPATGACFSVICNGFGATSDGAKSAADQFCAGLPVCGPGSICICTSQPSGPDFQCTGTCAVTG